MGRYHKFKLGLAILFYAAYCVGPMNAQEESEDATENLAKNTDDSEFLVYYQAANLIDTSSLYDVPIGVEGKPGVDFPILSHIPRTTFNCRDVDSGYYADLDTDCQVFHICEEGKKISFLCPNGTIFQQADQICEWWFKVNCSNSPNLYEASAEQWRNSVLHRKASRRVFLNGDVKSTGAVLRTEEHLSVSAKKNGKDIEVENDLQNNVNPRRGHQRTSSNYRPAAKHRVVTHEEERYTRVDQRSDANNNANNEDLTFNNENIKDNNGVHVQNENLKYRQSNRVNENNNNNQNDNYRQNNRDNERANNGQSSSILVSSNDKSDQHVRIQAQKSTKVPKNNGGKIKLTLSTANNAVNVNGAPVTQQVERSNKKPESKNIKLTLSSVNNQVSVGAGKQRVQGNAPNNRGGFKYNQNPSNKVTTQQTNSEISINTTPSYSTINDLTAQTYETQFPKHSSEKSKQESKNLDTDIKQKSTVPLTRNDIVNRRLEPSDSEETQITQESASFVKSPYNSIQNSYKPSTVNPYPNHRTTYSDLKPPNYSTTKFVSTINSVTPQYLTTQPINNGKPFIGSRVGTTVPVIKNVNPTTQTSSSFGANVEVSFPTTFTPNPTNSYSTTPVYQKSQFTSTNQGPSTVNYISTTSTSSPFTSTRSSTHSPLFNVGNTGSTIKPVSINRPTTQNPYAKVPLSLFVPDKFNIGVNNSAQIKTTNKPIRTGIFNLGLGKVNITEPNTPNLNPQKAVDHKIVYGSFSKDLRITTPPPFDINQGVQIKFNKDTKKVNIQLAKTVVSPHQQTNFNIGSTQVPLKPQVTNSQSGFFVTRDGIPTTPVPLSTGGFNLGTSSSNYYGKNTIQKPRPFEKTVNIDTGKSGSIKSSTESNNYNSVTPTKPTYKISTATPFTTNQQSNNYIRSTQPTPLQGSVSSRFNSVYENVDNMLNVLMEIAKTDDKDYENDTPRPGLVVPPSAGPQTLHTLAVYFANALDGIVAENEKNHQENEEDTQERYNQAKQSIATLLTKMTLNRYNELFDEPENNTETVTIASRLKESDEGKNGLIGEHSNGIIETPHIRQLARNFSIALSSYLDDPEMFRKELQGLRPTEPPHYSGETTTELNAADEELLNFSDADSKSSYPPIYPTIPSVSPTWGYILAYNVSKDNNLDVKNSLSPDLLGADSQSFVPRFNNLNSNTKTQNKNAVTPKAQTDLPLNHWTSSSGATKLWKTTFGVNPISVNAQFGTTPSTISDDYDNSNGKDYELGEAPTGTADLSQLKHPHHEIKYEVRQLPKISLNSTQVHGILIDFMNTSKFDDNSRLQRILHKLNTTEGEFLTKMREIENNPLTKRLILLLISECGANITKEIQSGTLSPSFLTPLDHPEPIKKRAEPTRITTRNTPEAVLQSNSNIPQLISPAINEDDHDTRALQLLNSLYTIASRFGK